MKVQLNQVQLHPKWLILFGSTIIVFLLREHRTALVVYTVLFIGIIVLYALWLPLRVTAAERRFERDTLRHLASHDFAGLDALVRRQWLIRTFGRKHVLPNALALAASAAGQSDTAVDLYRQALVHAPPEQRTQIELNLGTEELQLGRWDAAEGRLRAVLRKRPDIGIAQASLARILVRKGEELPEAMGLIEQALEMADAREAADLQLLLAEARLLSGHSGWDVALTAAREGGVDGDSLARIEALANSQSAIRG